LHKSFISKNLTDLFHHNELSRSQYSKQFREIIMHSLEGSRNFMASHVPRDRWFEDQLPDFVSNIVFRFFDLATVLTIFSQILLEKQLVFVSHRRDLISKVMFTFKDILLSITGFKWQSFCVTCLPSLFIDNLNAPFPAMIGTLKEILESQIDEIFYLHLEGKENTTYPSESPVIVDIDRG